MEVWGFVPYSLCNGEQEEMKDGAVVGVDKFDEVEEDSGQVVDNASKVLVLDMVQVEALVPHKVDDEPTYLVIRQKDQPGSSGYRNDSTSI